MSETTSPATAPAQAPQPLPALSAPAGRSGWLANVALVLFLVALFVPGLLLGNDKYWLPLFTRYMSLALFAMSVDLVWGYTGLLSLGQGLYFGLGAYAVGYSLKLRSAALEADQPFVAAPNMAMPDFMAYCRLPAVPSWIAPLIDLRLALALAILLPTLAAAAFGVVAFWRRIKGVYFSLITQALVLAAFVFVVSQQPYTGGVVGMTRLAKLELFGHQFIGPSLYYLTTSILVGCFLVCLLLVRSKFGKVLTAIRDSEYRVLALGYNTAMYKTFVFALAGGIAGLAGALYVSSMGTTGPDRLSIATSIEVVIFVAVGGRGTLSGAILGAILVNLANTFINDTFGQAWPLMLGGLFILVVVFLPEGILGGLRKLAARLQQSRADKHASSPAEGG
jgi:urea transport system permease protein